MFQSLNGNIIINMAYNYWTSVIVEKEIEIKNAKVHEWKIRFSSTSVN